MATNGYQPAEFMALPGALTECVQDYQPIAYDESIYRKYAGVSLAYGGFVQVGYDTDAYYEAMETAMAEVVKNRRVGEDGFLIVTDGEWNIVSDRSNNSGQPITIVTAMTEDLTKIENKTMFEEGIYIDGAFQRSFCMFDENEGFKIIAVYPYSEAMVSRDVSLSVFTVLQIVIFGALFVLILSLFGLIQVQERWLFPPALLMLFSGQSQLPAPNATELGAKKQLTHSQQRFIILTLLVFSLSNPTSNRNIDSQGMCTHPLCQQNE